MNLLENVWTKPLSQPIQWLQSHIYWPQAYEKLVSHDDLEGLKAKMVALEQDEQDDGFKGWIDLQRFGNPGVWLQMMDWR